MAQMTRHCRECGADQPFDQPHDRDGNCPDVPDGSCPEWACTGCGAAIIAGLPDLMADASGLRGWPCRVA
jgi:hypothetical protein